MNRKDTQNKGYNQKGYQDRQQNPQGGNQGNQNRNTNYNNTYNDRPRTQGGYKNNYEETKQQTNAKPATSTAKPAQNTANAAQDTNFREEFKEFFEEVKQFETKMDAFKKNPKSTDGYYYLLSNKAMKEWKEYLDYANITADKKPYISISRKPNKVNEDMVLEDKSFLQYPDKTHPCGVVIKPDLEKDKDFIIVNEDVWIFFKGKYGGLDIMRKGAVDEQGNITLVKTMHVVTLIIMYSTYLKSLENNKNDALRVRKLQVPLEFTVKAFKQQMAKIFNKLAIFKYNIESGCLRIWQMDPKFPSNEEFRAYLHDCCVKSRTYDYQIQFDGKLLDREPSAYLEEINPEMKDALVIEINQPGKLWIFFNEYVKACKKCVFCGKIDFLDFECICGQVAYCSEHCKYSDKGNHVKKCEKAYDSDENKEVATVTNPIDGLAGLENLGNTCYMNSAIQCLSNIKELTEHFLNQKYKQEINEQNPLGTKGKIVRKYAYLVKKLWLDNKREFAPYSLKLAVSKFQTMFHGQNQHDSQEFLFYLLDTIHEDLNRVIQKPLTDPIEAGSKSDLAVGRESWEVFLKRNQSIVVDLMYGQFKSTIECLACRRASKSFESFSICSIPIPNQKEIEVFFVHENHKKKPYRILLKYPDNKHTLLDLKHDLAFLLEKQADSIQLAVGDRNRVQPQYDLNVTTYEFSHQLQKNYLFAFELTQEEQRIPQNRRVFVGVQTLKADLVYEPKESMGVVKVIAVDTNMTNKEVHLKIFNKYRFMFDERWPYKTDRPYDTLSLEQACDEAFARSKKPIYEVVITRVGIEKEEEGVLEYNDDKFTNVLKLFEDPEKQLLLQVEWKSIPSFIELEYFRSFIKYDPYKGGINNKTNDEKKFIDISDCLSCFAEPEELDENNAWYCKNCSKHQNAKKVLELYKVPQIFILHLKRFKTGDNTRWNRTESKITDLITFPVENFDLSPYVTNPHLPSDYFGKEAEANGNVDGKKELQYDLIGVIHHIGNLNSGHYIAHCKNVKTGEWFAYDDERVRKIENLSEIVVNTAYILFYRRK